MTINYYFNVQTSEVSVVRELKKFAGRTFSGFCLKHILDLPFELDFHEILKN